jgi:hypothetical protein
VKAFAHLDLFPVRLLSAVGSDLTAARRFWANKTWPALSGRTLAPHFLFFVLIYRARPSGVASEAAAPLVGPLTGVRVHPRVSASSSSASAAAPLAACTRRAAAATSTARSMTLSRAHPRSGGGVFRVHTRGVAALALAHDDGRWWTTPSRAHLRSGGGVFRAHTRGVAASTAVG